MLSRDDLLKLIATFATSRSEVLAAWEGGSVAFARADTWSDIDLVMLVEDGSSVRVLEQFEATLAGVSPITDRWIVPEPTFHGHAQRFFRVKDASPFLLLDVVVQERSKGPTLIETERHGEARIIVDKQGLVRPPPLDHGAMARQRAARMESIKASFAMLQTLVEKEVLRGRPTDAMAFYVSQSLRPLVELLGMRYRPDRFDYGFRYTRDDFPKAVHDRLADLMYVKDLKDLDLKRRQVAKFVDEVLAELGASNS